MHKIIKQETIDAPEKYRFHCFPDINSDFAPSSVDEKQPAVFQRIDFAAVPPPEPAVETEPVPPPPETPEIDVLERAATKARKIEKEAYAKGYDKGEKEGLESGKKALSPMLGNLQQALVELEEVKREIIRKAERETVDLALAIAKKIICHEVSANKDALLSVVRKALEQVGAKDSIKIKVRKADLEFLRAHDFSKGFKHIKSISFEPDDTIQTGGCVIETDFGDIDARIENQMAIVEKALRSHFVQAAL